MNKETYILSFSDVNEEHISLEVKKNREYVQLRYDSKKDLLVFMHENTVSESIQQNEFQFKKIIYSALKGKVKNGQQIHFVFIPEFQFINERDYNKIIQIDRRGEKLKIEICSNPSKDIYKIYADGSYAQQLQQSGYAGIIIDKNGDKEIYTAHLADNSSNLMELLGVLEGLKRLSHANKIQINTDSRFVIRGLTQWIHFWKLNNWHTALGKKVKFVECWQEIDKLCEGKLLELKWIKAHSGDENHTFCHQLAKEIATTKNL